MMKTKTVTNDNTISKLSLLLCISTSLACLILLTQLSYANDDFAPPGSPGGPPPGSFFDGEMDSDMDFPEDAFSPPPSGNNPIQPRSTNNNPTKPRDNSKPSHSMGGNNGGVVAHSNIDNIQLDDESGDGSKELVTDFNFPDADIMDIAKTLGKLTGKNFILDKDVKGRVTIITNSAITVGDAWRAFLTALDINGFALIPSGKMIRIARQRDARDKQLKAFTGDYSPNSDALITRLFKLKYLSASEVASNFRSFMPANSRIIPYVQTNTVIVTDTGSNIFKLSQLLDILDVEGYDAGIEVIPVKYASAVELSKLIDTLIPGTGGGGSPAAGGAPRFGGSRFSARRTKEGGVINTIIADERTNTLIVHANQQGANEVRALVSKLDQRLPASTGGGKVHVVYLQFAESEQIANTLNNLSQGGKSAGGAAAGTGVNPVQTSLFEGNIRVSADKATNALVITASPGDFVTVQRVINKLDIPRDQVYVEVVIMEVSLGRDFTFSTNFASVVNPSSTLSLMPNTDLLDFIQSPISQKGAILSFGAGSTVPLNIGGTKIDVKSTNGLIKALQTNSNANILATPQIMTLDNQEATFETSERIPFPTTTAVQGAVSTSVSKENVSLVIKIKPQINKLSNFVKLDIDTKLADISGREPPAQVKDLALATVERNAKTSIVVADRDTVVLGGLMRDNQSEQTSKIPLLGDIPILGWLFKAKKTQNTKTNMLIFITPNIVRQYEKVRTILDKKLKERDNFLESNTGGEDPMRPHRDNMIRNLPEIEDVALIRPTVPIIEKTPTEVEVPEEGEEEAPLKVDGEEQKTPVSQTEKSITPPAPAPAPAENIGSVAPTILDSDADAVYEEEE